MALEAGLLQAIGGSEGSVTAEALSETTGFDALLIGTTLFEGEKLFER